ncbi:hypothetical protein Btru_066631 [Bulinus truncatus]|nr:hypothetical protein Btru_066631 [Bulinus truncatus]
MLLLLLPCRCEVCKMNVPHRVLTPDDGLKTMSRTLDSGEYNADYLASPHSTLSDDITSCYSNCSDTCHGIQTAPNKSSNCFFKTVNANECTITPRSDCDSINNINECYVAFNNGQNKTCYLPAPVITSTEPKISLIRSVQIF